IIEVFAPGYGYSSGAERIFEDQRPADDPGDQFAHGGISVGISATCDRYDGGELGVTKSRKTATDGGNNKGDGNGGSRMLPCRGGCPDEQTGPDDGSDAQGDQAPYAQGPFQAFFRLIGLRQKESQCLFSE